jgi:hypothetical protein
MEVFEQENYFDCRKQDLFVASIKRSLSCEFTSMDFDRMLKIEKKYSFNPGVVSVVEFTDKALEEMIL